MFSLKEREIDLSREAINSGLKRSAESLSFFMKEPVSISCGELYLNHMPDPAIIDKDHQMVILGTELKGEIGGVCYLVLSQEEEEKLIEICLPQNIRENPEKLEMMKDPVLMEIDNIISAAVITEFANIFKRNMHGGVPFLKRVSAVECEEELFHKNLGGCVISFNAIFSSSHIGFTPEFVWCLDNEFISNIKLMAEASV